MAWQCDCDFAKAWPGALCGKSYCTAVLTTSKSSSNEVERGYVAQKLIEAAALHESRNNEYDNAYIEIGDVLATLFRHRPLMIQTPSEWRRLANLIMTVGKLHRYTVNFAKGGHDDSLADLAVYATMQRHVDELSRG